MNHLHIVTCISNPLGWESRTRLYFDFAARVAREHNATLWTVEAAQGMRAHQVTDANHPNHLQLRTTTELWHKENMMNLIMSRLPNDGNPVAFVDADVMFTNPNWVNDTIEQLRHYDVVQMFGECMDMNSDNEKCSSDNKEGIVKRYLNGTPVIVDSADGYGFKQGGHPGYAWAWNRSALTTVGGLIDFSMLGSADWQMACGLLGNIEDSARYEISDGYRNALNAWGRRAARLRRNVGYVPGLVLHYWHGAKSDRGYEWRNKIYTETLFDPTQDLSRDTYGLYQWNDDGTDRYIQLRDGLRGYFRSRNEDAK